MGSIQKIAAEKSSRSSLNETGRQPTVFQQGWALLGFIVLCFAVGGIGGVVTNSALYDWYPTIAKPTWTPPNWVFGPVWSALYFMMACAVWLVWRQGNAVSRTVPMACFGIQLMLNLVWSLLFFGWRSPSAAFVGVLLLWVSIAATARVFAGRSRIAGLMMAPYLAWTSFAAILNFYIWRLNA
jgi:tryptophan-rich sensory protein